MLQQAKRKEVRFFGPKMLSVCRQISNTKIGILFLPCAFDADADYKFPGAKKKQLHIEKGEEDFVAGPGASYDDPDEFDFM